MKMISEISIKRRLLTVMVLITFLFIGVLGKIFYIQIIDGVRLQAKALDQWTRDIPLVATRGGIYDINGNLLAGTDTSYTIYVRPNAMTSVEDTASAIAQAVGLDYDKVYAKINRKGVSEITVAKNVTKQSVIMMKQSGADGIYISQNIKRYYPEGNFMSQILGFTNVDASGQAGIELYYNRYLTGINGYQLTETDLIGREVSSSIKYIPSIDGLNIMLSVDNNIQHFAESAVYSAFSKYNAKNAACVVMDVNTGAILALAQAPGYDLNNVPRDDISALFDMSKIICASNVYEQGSTFKILTTAIGINEGVVKETDRFYCTGSKLVDGQKIKCWKTKGHGSESFAEGVKNSCNVVFMEVALRVGTEIMYKYFREFGLTSVTGIDITGEAAGLLIPEASVKTVDLARIGFGQAIAITPLELMVAASACVNGGKIVTPYLLDSVFDKDGKLVAKNYPQIKRQVISEQSSERVRKLLAGVVEEGSGRLAGVPGYSIGGKTGTAQKYKDGTIDRGKYLSSFIGFSTVENPEYIVYFMVDEPQGYLYYGSLVAAPYVGEIFAKIFEYKGIAPTKPVTAYEEVVMPDLIGMTHIEAVRKLKALGLHYEEDGDGDTVTEQFPFAGTVCTTQNVVFIGVR